MDLFTIAVSTFTAFLAGIVASISGGGSLVMLPMLLVLGVAPHATLGTMKMVTTIGAASASIAYAAKKKINWTLALPGMVVIAPAAFAGSGLTLWISPDVLGKIMLGLLPVGMLIALVSPSKKQTTQPSQKLTRLQTWVIGPLIIVVCGVYDGFFGPGAGTFLIIALTALLRMDLITACGTGRFLTAVSCLVSVLVFGVSGQIVYELAVPMVLATVAGNMVGSRIALRGNIRLVRYFIFGTVTLLFFNLVYMYAF